MMRRRLTRIFSPIVGDEIHVAGWHPITVVSTTWYCSHWKSTSRCVAYRRQMNSTSHALQAWQWLWRHACVIHIGDRPRNTCMCTQRMTMWSFEVFSFGLPGFGPATYPECHKILRVTSHCLYSHLSHSHTVTHFWTPRSLPSTAWHYSWRPPDSCKLQYT